MIRNGHLVLLSGGVDSAAALALLRAEGHVVTAVMIDYGQPARDCELAAATAIAAQYGTPLEVINVSHRRPLGAGEVVGRNAFLITTAACLSPLESGLIITGIHGGTSYYDCSQPFLATMSRLIEEQSDGAIRLQTPFADWSKADVLSYARTSGIPFDLTYSCERGTNPPCGACASCKDRMML